MGRLVNLVSLVAAVALVCVAAAAAARYTASITLNEPAPAIGDTVTFTVTTDAPFVWVQVQCVQAGNLVYSELSTRDHGFQVGPTALWVSGSADCTAGVWTQKNGFLDKELASTGFTVTG